MSIRKYDFSHLFALQCINVNQNLCIRPPLNAVMEIASVWLLCVCFCVSISACPSVCPSVCRSSHCCHYWIAAWRCTRRHTTRFRHHLSQEVHYIHVLRLLRIRHNRQIFNNGELKNRHGLYIQGGAIKTGPPYVKMWCAHLYFISLLTIVAG